MLARNAHVLEVKRLPLSYARRAGLRGTETRVRPFPVYALSASILRSRKARYVDFRPHIIKPLLSSSRLAYFVRHTITLHASLGHTTLFSSLRPPSTVMKKAIRMARNRGTVACVFHVPRRNEISLWKRQEKVFTASRDNDGSAAG